jgi:hypothetical protein
VLPPLILGEEEAMWGMDVLEGVLTGFSDGTCRKGV